MGSKEKAKYNKNLKVVEVKDEFSNDKGYKIEGLVYDTEQEAHNAIERLIKEEFLSRKKK